QLVRRCTLLRQPALPDLPDRLANRRRRPARRDAPLRQRRVELGQRVDEPVPGGPEGLRAHIRRVAPGPPRIFAVVSRHDAALMPDAGIAARVIMAYSTAAAFTG